MIHKKAGKSHRLKTSNRPIHLFLQGAAITHESYLL